MELISNNDADSFENILEKVNVSNMTPEYIDKLEYLNTLLENKVSHNKQIISNIRRVYYESEKLKKAQLQLQSPDTN